MAAKKKSGSRPRPARPTVDRTAAPDTVTANMPSPAARPKGPSATKAPTAPAPRPKGPRARMVAEREAALAAEAARRRRMGIVAALVLLALVLGVGVFGWWRTTRAVPTATTPTSTATGSAAPVVFAPVTVADGKGIRIGAADAPNVVAVYLDFHCSHCRDFEKQYGETLLALQSSGRVTIEYWPLGFLSEGSKSASNAFACAAERDPVFARDLHDAFFGNQQAQWTDAQILGLSKQLRAALPDGYETCVTTKPHLAWVTGNYDLAKKGPAAKGTPTVYVNGQELDLATSTPATLIGRLT